MRKLNYLFSNSLIDYQTAVSKMELIVADILNKKLDSTIWLLEHPPIYTAGSSAKNTDLLYDKFPVYKTGRGGQYTYHGPGQRVIYCMIDLKKIQDQPDIKEFVKKLEDVAVNSFKDIGLSTFINNRGIGIWTKQSGKLEKIAAIGIRVKKWITYHGIAINITPNLSHYEGIIPCGIKEYGITSLEQLGYKISLMEFDKIILKNFCKVFEFEIRNQYEIN